MAQDKITLPSGMGGITRYFEDYHSKVEFTPGHVIILTVVVILIVLLLHLYGAAMFGL